MKCKHCGSEFEGKFCPECGTRAELETTVVSQNAQEQKDAAQQNFPVFKEGKNRLVSSYIEGDDTGILFKARKHSHKLGGRIVCKFGKDYG